MKIFFGVALYRGKAHPAFGESLLATVELLMQQGHCFQIGEVSGCCYVQVARNLLVRKFMDTDADVLVFLDDDVSWQAEDLLRLVSMPDEMVAGIYPMKQEEEAYPVVIFTDERERAITRADGCIRASGVPAGFLAIKRAAIEKLIEAHPEQRYGERLNGVYRDDYYDLFPQGVRAGRWWGEDMAFCHLWRELGEPIWVVPDVNLNHHGTIATPQGDEEKTWRGNYHEFLLRQPGGSMAEAS